MLSRTTARLQLVGAALLFSTGGAAIKASAFSGWQLSSLRSGIAAVTVLLLAPAARRGWSWRTAVVALAYAATLTLFVMANKLTTSANTIFLQSTAPLYMVLLSPWLLRERVRRNDLVLMAVVAVGLVLFFVGADAPARTAPDPRTGNLLALASGVCWALTVCGLRWMGSRPGAGPGDGIACVALGNVLACLACLPMALPLADAGARDWLGVVFLGVFQIAVAYLLVTSALRALPALEASVLLLVEPALNPVLTWLVHGERPGLLALAGGGLIIGATTLKSVLESRASGAAPAAAPLAAQPER